MSTPPSRITNQNPTAIMESLNHVILKHLQFSINDEVDPRTTQMHIIRSATAVGVTSLNTIGYSY